jgi:hypothetical protein
LFNKNQNSLCHRKILLQNAAEAALDYSRF